MSRAWKLAAGFLLVAALFLLAADRLMRDRLEKGDVYPPYSTLRADPLGAKAFFDALKEMPGVEADRYMRPLDELDRLPPAAFFYLGDVDESWRLRIPEEMFAAIELWMRSGGRFIISLEPQRYTNTWTEEMREKQVERVEEQARRQRRKEREGNEKDSKDKDDDSAEDIDRFGQKYVALKERWGIRVKREPLPLDSQGKAEAVTVEAVDRDWGPLPWQSVQFFEPVNEEAWKAVVTRDGGKPVVMERSFGKGSLIIVSDSYLFSNEGLWRDRQPEFLSWLIGGHRRIYFDEAHFGAVDQPGVATLARRYGLFGGVYMLALLALLFIWRNAASLAPAYVEPPPGSSLGEESSMGMVNLLKRSVPSATLIPLCIEEWSRTGGARAKRHRGEIEQAWQAEQSAAKRPDLISAYRRIQQILQKKAKS